MHFLSCRAQPRHLLILVILKVRDSSTSLGMTKAGDSRLNRSHRFGQHALNFCRPDLSQDATEVSTEDELDIGVTVAAANKTFGEVEHAQVVVDAVCVHLV